MAKSVISLLMPLLVIFCSFEANAEKIELSKYSAYTGRHFYFGFMQNEISIDQLNGGVILKAFIASSAGTKFQVKVPGHAIVYDSIGTNQIREIEIDNNVEMREEDCEKPIQRTVEIISDMPICLYAFSSQHTTSDAFATVPVSRWGKDYYVVSYPNDQYESTAWFTDSDSLMRYKPRSSEFMVMAAYDSTVLSIKPSALTRGGMMPTTTSTFMLNKGDVFLVQAADTPIGMGDLTGSHVSANKPIGVLSGHVRTGVPQKLLYPYDSKDHLCEMLNPTDSWGDNFNTVPFGLTLTGDIYRVISREPSTRISIATDTDTLLVNLNGSGDWKEIQGLTKPATWKSTEPIQILQYMRHDSLFGDSFDHDPSMVLLPPAEQYLNDILFLTPRNYRANDQYKYHKVSLIAEAEALPTLTLDGESVVDLTDIELQRIANSKYYWANFIVREGRHKLFSRSGKFSGIMFGHGFRDSYAMSMGHGLTNPFKPDSIAPVLNITDNCGRINAVVTDNGDPDATGLDYGYVEQKACFNYTWNVSYVSDTATVMTFTAAPKNIFEDGRFEFYVYDKSSNGQRYTYNYQGIKTALPKEVAFDNVFWQSSVCKSFYVKNNGKGSLHLDSLSLGNDKRLSYTSSVDFPYEIAKGDSILVTVCFEPNGDSTRLKSFIDVYFGCSVSYKININGSVLAPDIIAAGKSFGAHRVGDIVCDSVYITNKGNTPIVIDSIAYTAYSRVFDTKLSDYSFPYIINPKQTIGIYVCFKPDTVKKYVAVLQVYNNSGVDAIMPLNGSGVAPRIESLDKAWGPRRIGTNNDTTLYLVNYGKYPAYLSFKGLVSGDPAQPELAALQAINNRLINPGDSIAVQFIFSPTTTAAEGFACELQTDWDPHGLINISESGYGTIPVIKTKNFRFDTTRIFQQADSAFVLASSEGNEVLTIDQAISISGDINSFIIDYNALINLKVATSTTYSVPAKFAPMRIGEHSMQIEITHDAMPNYARAKDTITVSGFCLPADTISMVYEETLPTLTPCVANTGNFKIKNTGNVIMHLEEINISRSPDNFTAEWAINVNSMLPLNLAPGDSMLLPIKLYAERNTGGDFNINLKMNDSVYKNFTFTIIPNHSALSVTNAVRDLLQAGDTTTFVLSGSLPHTVDKKITFNPYLKFDRKFLYLLNNNGEFRFNGPNGELKVAAQFTQKEDGIGITLDIDSIDTKAFTSWSANIGFLVLLAERDTCVVDYGIAYDDCYDPANVVNKTLIDNVCVQDLRLIQSRSAFAYAFSSPNPASDKLNVEINLIEDGNVDLYLSDMNGKKYSLSDNLFLKKGKHCLIFELNDITSGTYLLAVRTKQLYHNEIFIITK